MAFAFLKCLKIKKACDITIHKIIISDKRKSALVCD